MDFIFTDASKVGESNVLPLKNDDPSQTLWQLVSDHAAVECKIAC